MKHTEGQGGLTASVNWIPHNFVGSLVLFLASATLIIESRQRVKHPTLSKDRFTGMGVRTTRLSQGEALEQAMS